MYIYWKDTPPTLASGKFVAMWVMMHSIAAAPGFISLPIDMAVLELKAGNCTARRIDQEELQEHQASVDASVEHLKDFERVMQNKLAEAPPAPEPPAR